MEKSLDNIVTLFSGNAWKAASFKPNGKIQIIRIQNIGENKSKEFIYWDEDYNETFIVKKGDLLLSLSGSIKLDFWDGQPALLNQRIVKISPKEGIDTHWLFFQLKNYVRKITNMGNHALVNNVSLTDLRKLTLKVPEYPDQLHIANLLSKAENLIAQRKESIRLLDEFLKSTFLEMFGNVTRNEKGFEKIKFGKVAKNENSKRVPVKQGDRDKREGIYPYYGATGVIDTIDDYKFDGEYLLIAEDGKNLLFRRKNNAFIATGKFWVNNHAHVLSYNGVCNLRYLEFFLNSIDFRPYISGIDQVKLNKENLDKIPVPVPPLTLQTQFAQIVEKTEALKTRYQQSLQELENLYGSLSQKAFRGELKMKQNV